MIGLRTSIGNRPHRVTFQGPGPLVPDNDGGWVEGWVDLNPPHMSVRIEPATGADLERVAPGTVMSHKSHIVTAPYHPGVTTRSRLLYNGRVFNVIGIANSDERNVETVLVCDEVEEVES